MDQLVKQYLPLLTMRERHDDDHRDILLKNRPHSLIDDYSDDGIEIHTTPYIDSHIICNANSDAGRWKLRQPFFENINRINTGTVLSKMNELGHPYYKRITIIDKNQKHVIKLYSTEHRKNYAIGFQGDQWAENIRNINKYSDLLPRLYYYNNAAADHIHAAVFEFIDGVSLAEQYAEYDKKIEYHHPGVEAGDIEPYHAKISAVGLNHLIKVKRVVCDMFLQLWEISNRVPLANKIYQRLDNEPDWADMWSAGDSRRMINVDDWRLENILETTSNRYRFHKPDRIVVTDPTNAATRLSADLRNQTNIHIDPSRILDALK